MCEVCGFKIRNIYSLQKSELLLTYFIPRYSTAKWSGQTSALEANSRLHSENEMSLCWSAHTVNWGQVENTVSGTVRLVPLHQALHWRDLYKAFKSTTSPSEETRHHTLPPNPIWQRRPEPTLNYSSYLLHLTPLWHIMSTSHKDFLNHYESHVSIFNFAQHLKKCSTQCEKHFHSII